MNRIVCIKKDEPVTTSQIISEWTGREHARKCSSGEVSGYGNPLFRVDKMERIEL